MSYLANFVDNHDNARLLSSQASGGKPWEEKKTTFRSMIAMTLTSVGIPIVYYGNEQYYTGGNDPGCRESLWQAMNTGSDLYQMIAKINQAR